MELVLPLAPWTLILTLVIADSVARHAVGHVWVLLDMNKDGFAAVIRCDEPEALVLLERLDRSRIHGYEEAQKEYKYRKSTRKLGSLSEDKRLEQ